MLPFPSVHSDWASQFLHKIDLSSHPKILELGCRQGNSTRRLATSYTQQQWIAIDNVASELEQASQYQLPNVEFILQDARKLDLPMHFDAVISLNNAFMWIQEKSLVLKNIYTALKPGGKVYLQFFVRHGYPKNDRFLYDVANQLEWKSYFKKFVQNYYDVRIADFCRMLDETGFVVNRLELAKYATYFAHSDLLQEFFKSWGAQTQYLPQPKQDHYWEQVTASYLNYHQYAKDDAFQYFEYVIEIICEKPLNPIEDDRIFQYGSILFSEREAQVLKYFLQGYAAKEIGAILVISPKTVEFHLASIKEKAHCRKRSDIFKAALAEGFISLMFDKKL